MGFLFMDVSFWEVVLFFLQCIYVMLFSSQVPVSICLKSTVIIFGKVHRSFPAGGQLLALGGLPTGAELGVTSQLPKVA